MAVPVTPAIAQELGCFIRSPSVIMPKVLHIEMLFYCYCATISPFKNIICALYSEQVSYMFYHFHFRLIKEVLQIVGM